MINYKLRITNFLIDSTAYFILLFCIIYLFKNIIHQENVKLLAVILYFFYYFLFEHLFLKTPAKYLTKSVVEIGENKNRFITILIRSFVRILPIDILSYFILENGLHDKLSKSQTIKLNQK